MGTLVITGVSGFLGQALLQSLDRDPARPARVVGIDIRFPTYSPPWLVFYSHDVREDVLAARLKREQAEQLVHLANPQVPMRDERLRRQIVVGGAKNVLSACAQAGVRHLLMLSSAVVYGPREDTDAVVTEDSPLRGHPRFGYARDMIRVQRLVEEFAEQHPETTITVLRPGVVLGPRVNNFWARFLLKTPFLPRTSASATPLHFLHLADLVRAMGLALQKRPPGAFNIIGKGRLSFERAGEILGKMVVWIPAMALYPLFEACYQLHLPGADVPSAALDFLLNPSVMDGERAAQQLGFRPSFGAEVALQALLDDPPR